MSPPPILQEGFEPTYEWQPIANGQAIPSGLEVQLTMHEAADGSREPPPRLARIPPLWRLQIWLGSFFARIDVSRGTTVAQLEAEAGRQLTARRNARCTVTLRVKKQHERLPAERAGAVLFVLQHALEARSECALHGDT